jgi:polyhydroxybutyrate depolymerase
MNRIFYPAYILSILVLFYIGLKVIAEENSRLDKTLVHEGMKRSYYIHLPPGFKKEKSAPLVIALHGGGGKGRRLDKNTTRETLSTAADKRGVVLVFPEGIDKKWCDGRNETLKKGEIYDDVGFISKS